MAACCKQRLGDEAVSRAAIPGQLWPVLAWIAPYCAPTTWLRISMRVDGFPWHVVAARVREVVPYGTRAGLTRVSRRLAFIDFGGLDRTDGQSW